VIHVAFVSIKSGFLAADGSEETLTEYLCDRPGCANRAVHWLGGIPQLGVTAAVCDEHRAPAGPDSQAGPDSPAVEETPVRQPLRRQRRFDA
jgi:hypothetical protein